jgi:hypothetical protein
MKFRTELQLSKSLVHISHQDTIFMMGSCFSENLGELLSNAKFKTSINPFGIIYDPISIFKVLNWSIDQTTNQFSILERGGAYYSFETHSKLYESDKNSLINTLNNVIKNTHNQILNTNIFFITLGTSFVYKYKETEQYVANCHKQDAKLFDKVGLSPDEILVSFAVFYKQIKALNPSIQIVFTLSPVRHIKDGIEENQLSKSILRYCIAEFCKEKDVCYFPAYELVMDDLRDYRFYKEDLIHPNEQAIQYIWEKFSAYYFHSDTIMLNRIISKTLQNIAHKPFNVNGEAYKVHLQQTLIELQNLPSYVDVTDEILKVNELLSSLK